MVFLPKMSFFHQTITLSDDEEEEEEKISFESEVLAQVSTYSPTYPHWMEVLFLPMFLVPVLIFVNMKVSVCTFYMFLMKFSINQVLACYNERLSTSKEEEEEDFGEDEKMKATKKVSFEF